MNTKKRRFSYILTYAKRKNRSEQNYQTLVIIWAALLFSQVLFLVMIYFVKPEVYNFEFTQPIGGKQPVLVMALAAAAVFNFFLSFKMRRKYLTESVEKQNVGLVQTAMIIGCALGESISLFGLLLVFVQGYQYFFLFFALGILAIVLSFPRRDDVMAAGFKRLDSVHPKSQSRKVQSRKNQIRDSPAIHERSYNPARFKIIFCPKETFFRLRVSKLEKAFEIRPRIKR